MRDGAEMDLDLDVTQRMIENNEKDSENMDKVINSLNVALNIVDNENKILDDELQYYERLVELSEQNDKELQHLNEKVRNEEHKYKELLLKVNWNFDFNKWF